MDFTWNDQLTPAQTEVLVGWYQQEWWSGGRQPKDVQRMLTHSKVVALAGPDGQLAAFSRVVSDFTYKALILDVIVAPSLRGQGLGRRMMGEILERLKEVAHLELYCAGGMVPFYQSFGFEVLAQSEALFFMRKVQKALK
ncbi:MAG: GNAT family N-acetyltransferase [Deltaproteobacteria bacterium]|nr:GNAT family N-acetyltransferase [Deltaproteobacteria bacterium]